MRTEADGVRAGVDLLRREMGRCAAVGKVAVHLRLATMLCPPSLAMRCACRTSCMQLAIRYGFCFLNGDDVLAGGPAGCSDGE